MRQQTMCLVVITTFLAGVAVSRARAQEKSRGFGVTNTTQGTDHPTLQSAIDAAADFDELQITLPELFENEITLDGKTLTIRGLGPGLGGPPGTVIDAQRAGRCMTIRNTGEGTRISYIHFRNGFVDADAGGAVRVDSADVEFTDCWFSDHQATNGDGGIGIVFGESYASFDRCRFSDSSADYAGGFWIVGPVDARFNNCLFEGIAATDPGAIDVLAIQSGARSWMVYCTVARCGTDGNLVFGAPCDEAECNFFLQNSIVWDNATDHGLNGVLLNPLGRVRASILPGVAIAQPSHVFNIDADPMFRDPDAGDFRLTSGSPAVDSGHGLFGLGRDREGLPTVYLPQDIRGDSRYLDDPATPDTGDPDLAVTLDAYEAGIPIINRQVMDRGAYEFIPPARCVEADMAEPYGEMDFDDVLRFLTSFGAGCP